MPVQKYLPEPVITTIETLGSLLIESNASTMLCAISTDKELPFSGLFKVMVATWSLVEMMTGGDDMQMKFQIKVCLQITVVVLY